MKNRTVRLIRPRRSSNLTDMSVSSVPINGTESSIYDTVDFFRNEVFSNGGIEEFGGQIKKRVLLRDMVNLHNDTGIRDISQIDDMIRQIKSGEDILSRDGLPNIKLVRTKRGEWVLFDGHHSMLSYMLAGKKYLDEVPHIIVEDGESVTVSDGEIHAFFGKHLTNLENKDWRDYVIDWQALDGNQLQPRIQHNMGELLDTLPRNEYRLY